MQHYSTNVTWLRRLAAGVTVAGMDTGCGATPVVWRGGAEPVDFADLEYSAQLKVELSCGNATSVPSPHNGSPAWKVMRSGAA